MSNQLQPCDHCDKAISLDRLDFWQHVDTESVWCARTFNDTSRATPSYRDRYTVIFNDGIGPSSGEPEAPCNDNQAGTLEDARYMFRNWLRESGNDYHRSAGYGQPQAEVIRTSLWDGISYGDYPWTAILTRGPRGGVVRESI